MRTGIQKAIVLSAMGGLTAVVVWHSEYQKDRVSGSSSVTSVSQNVAAAAQTAAGSRRDAPRLFLRERQALGEPTGALFGLQSPAAPPKIVSAAPPPPSAPPLPYRFAGKLLNGESRQIFLAKGNVVIPISEDKVLGDTYRVESIGENYVTLIYLPLNHKQNIALSHVTSTRHPRVAVEERGKIADSLARWKELSQSEQRRIRQYLREMPPSAERDQLYAQYRRHAYGTER